ncbi:senescence-associated protein-domain-containing protein [Lipomyces doorenjongii]
MSEEDFCLYLHVPLELDMPLHANLPASSVSRYWHRSEQVTQGNVDTFGLILAQCTAFLERAAPPKRQAAYHTADHAPGEGDIPSARRVTGKIVLVDEEDGSVVGELTDGYDIVEKPGVKPGSNFQRKAKVIRSVSATFLRNISGCPDTPSTIVQTSASRLIVTGSSCLNNVFASGAYSFTKKSKPNPKPVAFSADTHIRIRKISSISHGAADLSVKTVSQVSKYAQNFGASSAGGNEMDQLSCHDGSGNRVDDKPGILNRSLIACSTLADGIEQSSRTVLSPGSSAVTTMIGHRHGPEAGAVAAHLRGGVKTSACISMLRESAVRRSISQWRMSDVCGTEASCGGRR